jgi:hypothetical protein
VDIAPPVPPVPPVPPPAEVPPPSSSSSLSLLESEHPAADKAATTNDGPNVPKRSKLRPKLMTILLASKSPNYGL